ncbi:hypothetical protein [Spirosoma sp. KNUC1025]|uniref:hypothetical protein n=1 Tax=Spirosoma sp. KNUC1025 TaxID=2894082 RepID=UPI00386CC6A8|nr:DUF481 domain-containing protein [Spirosoma sp. KNUC1025]
MFSRRLLVLFFTFWSSYGHGQVLIFTKSTIDSLPPGKLVGGISLTGSLSLERAQFLLLEGSVNGLYGTNRHTYEVAGSVRYTTYDHLPTSSRGFLSIRGNIWKRHLEDDHLVPHRFYLEPFAYLQYDDQRGLNLRAQVGAMGSVRLRNGTKSRFTAGAGFFYEYEQWQMIPRTNRIMLDTLPQAVFDLYQEYLGLNRQGQVQHYDPKTCAYIGYAGDVSPLVTINGMLQWQQPLLSPYHGKPIYELSPDFRRLWPRFMIDVRLMLHLSKHLNLLSQLMLQHDRGQLGSLIPYTNYAFQQGILVTF